MKSLTPLLLALLLTACSGGSYLTWQHPSGLGDKERLQAEKTCDEIVQDETWRSVDYPPYYGRYYNRSYYYGYPFAYRHSFGYGYYDYPGYVRAARSAFRVCMRAKGWQQVEKQRAVEAVH
ncbi:hypothetical protein [Geothermobacter hydrogeniphilus]|uniref:Lipoprotein n=1 Tax=Geothermobacter hydrogeniphilus TaxID=1969733 RepID=A0A1X0Y8Z9_9BACT|nr:hypothetical protein [Geothermobacter hydrogeniphilus]ORJ61628.1 hypothetical protein B5V00_06240 [Geothermobacter hydrogeniphilus]